jgi:hypothetical protein
MKSSALIEEELGEIRTCIMDAIRLTIEEHGDIKVEQGRLTLPQTQVGPEPIIGVHKLGIDSIITVEQTYGEQLQYEELDTDFLLSILKYIEEKV